MDEKETLEQKKRKIYGKQYLNQYLKELKNILTKDINEKDLLSIVITDKIAQNERGKLLIKDVILFDDKEALENILERCLKSKQFYLFISHSLYCGTCKINLFTDFNFKFSFEDLSSKIINLCSIDFREEIILDFYEEDNIKYLQVEIYEIM